MCECEKSGWCERRKIHVNPVHWKACQAGQVERVDGIYATIAAERSARAAGNGFHPAFNTDAFLERTRSLWRELHNIPLGTQWYRGKEVWKAWLKRVPKRGCSCSAKFTKMLEKRPPDWSSREAFFDWTVAIHNDVNLSLNKPEFSLEEAKTLYRVQQLLASIEPEPPVPPRQLVSSRKSRSRKSSSAFRFSGGNARFITSAQLQEDIKVLIGKIPHDITAIAGVARSGVSVATMLSMYLHLPMITIRQTMNDIVAVGNGWRLGGTKHVEPKGKILVVDDTVMTGNSLKAIAPLVERELGNAVYAAVYVNPLAHKKPDIWAVDLGWPHLLEWNIFNSILSPSMAVDFDGILCRDCHAGADDDGPRYLDFIRNAQPLYVPRRVPIPLIVTARIEKYRADTEAWLRRQGINWHRLVMHPAATTRERMRDDIPAYKARHYKAWAAKHRAAPGPIIFCESEDWQAVRIAQLSGRMTICPHTAGVY